MTFNDEVKKETDLLPQEEKTKIIRLFLESFSPIEISSHLKIIISVVHKVIMEEIVRCKLLSKEAY